LPDQARMPPQNRFGRDLKSYDQGGDVDGANPNLADDHHPVMHADRAGQKQPDDEKSEELDPETTPSPQLNDPDHVDETKHQPQLSHKAKGKQHKKGKKKGKKRSMTFDSMSDKMSRKKRAVEWFLSESLPEHVVLFGKVDRI
jgi:hypothetical protein